MRKKLTTEEWIQKARAVHGDKYDYSKVDYQGANEKVCIICPEHGEFWQRAAHHITGHNCPKCGGKVSGDRLRKTTKQFIEEARKVHGDKYDYSKTNYINNKTYINIICPKHGIFKQLSTSHLQGRGCPECGIKKASYKRSSNTEQFIEKANKVHNNKYNYDKVNYTNNHTIVTIICPEHGEFNQFPSKHLCGHGCPKCKLKSQTKLYEKLKASFPNKEILFEVGKEVVPWLGLQRFDIYFTKYNIAIEYNGQQHYVPVEYFGGELKFQNQLEYDELKRQKCKENNCTLFEIRYDYSEQDYNNLIININKIIDNYGN